MAKGFICLYGVILILAQHLQPHGFIPETLVAVNCQTLIPLGDISLNTDLWDYNSEIIERVLSKQELEVDHLTIITLSNGEQIISTPEQPFLCLYSKLETDLNNQEAIFNWRSASNLTPNNYVVALNEEDHILKVQLVDTINLTGSPHKIIRLTTLPDHIFCITKSLVVVHNFNQDKNNGFQIAGPILSAGLTTLLGPSLAMAIPLIFGGYMLFKQWQGPKINNPTLPVRPQAAINEQYRQLNQPSTNPAVPSLEQPPAPSVAINPLPNPQETADYGWPTMPPLEKGPFIALNLEQELDAEQNTWLRITAENAYHQTLAESSWSIFDQEGFWTKDLTSDGTLLAMADANSHAKQTQIKSHLQELLDKAPSMNNNDPQSKGQALTCWANDNQNLLQTLMMEVRDLKAQHGELKAQHNQDITDLKQELATVKIDNQVLQEKIYQMEEHEAFLSSGLMHFVSATLAAGGAIATQSNLYTAIAIYALSQIAFWVSEKIYQKNLFTSQTPKQPCIMPQSQKMASKTLAFINYEGNFWGLNNDQYINYNNNSTEKALC